MASVFETIKRILFRPIQVRTCFEARTDEFLAAMRAASEYRNSGDTVQASQQCQTMISLLEDITRQCTGIAAQRFVAAGYFDVGSLYREMEHVPEAERCFATAIEKFERLKNNSSQTHFSDSMLAGCQNQLGMLYSDCGPLDKAETALDNAIARRKRIVSEVPDDMENRVYLAGAICNRAHVASKSGQRDAAIALYDQSLQMLDQTIPPCDCGCRDAIAGAMSEAMGHPHWILTAHHFRRNAEAGRQYWIDSDNS